MADATATCVEIRERVRPSRLSSVNPHLPLDLADVIRWHGAELGTDEVAVGTRVVAHCGLGVRLAAALTAADPSDRNASDPLVADALEGAAARGQLSHACLALASRAKPGEGLVSVLDDGLLPLRLPREGIAPSTAPRRDTSAPAVIAVLSGAAQPVSDVDPRRLRLAPIRHDASSGLPRKLVPRGTHGGTQMSAVGAFVGVRWGRNASEQIRAYWLCRAEFGSEPGCRRRDSNPRHADYDSAALTD